MFLRTLLLALGAIALGSTNSFAAPTIQAADAAPVGSELSVTVTGNANPRDFVTVVPKAAKEGSYETYAYLQKGGTFKLVLPSAPGDYELRVLSADSPYPTLAKRPIKLEAATATLDAPAQVSGGAKFEVKWTGPKNARDYIGIGDAKRPYVTYLYTNQGNPLRFTAPDEAGSYELRYFLGSGDTVIASRPIVVGSVAATVSAPASVGVGASLKVSWQGPNNPRDFITIVKVGTPQGRYDDYVYTSAGNPVELRAPEQPGDYEVRYLTGATPRSVPHASPSQRQAPRSKVLQRRSLAALSRLPGPDRITRAISSTSYRKARARVRALHGPTRHKAIPPGCVHRSRRVSTSCATPSGSRTPRS